MSVDTFASPSLSLPRIHLRVRRCHVHVSVYGYIVGMLVCMTTRAVLLSLCIYQASLIPEGIPRTHSAVDTLQVDRDTFKVAVDMLKLSSTC
jgi:hypothetical protein